MVEKWCCKFPRYLLEYGRRPLSIHFSTSFLFISKDVFAKNIIRSNLLKNSSFVSDKNPILGKFIVTTPTLPVCSPEPNKPPVFALNSFKFNCNLQHILLTSLGFNGLLIKF